jgi:hypothetical protein
MPTFHKKILSSSQSLRLAFSPEDGDGPTALRDTKTQKNDIIMYGIWAHNNEVGTKITFINDGIFKSVDILENANRKNEVYDVIRNTNFGNAYCYSVRKNLICPTIYKAMNIRICKKILPVFFYGYEI